VKKTILPTLVLLAAASVAVCAPGKSTIDPSRVRTSPVGQTVDQQLAQKVTYSGGGKRLHSVLEELAKATGVRIRSGKNNTDWQVRDLPIDVYAKDVPLDKLLGWIAQASHLTLSSGEISQSSGANVQTYAIRRDRQGENELQADEARSLAEASWCWDVFAKLGQEPTRGADATDQDATSRQLASKIIASLPPDAKEQVFAGEAFVMDAESSGQSQLIRELVKATASKGMSADFGVARRNGSPQWSMKYGATFAIGPSVITSQTDSDAKQTTLRIQLFDLGGKKGTSVVFVISPMVFDKILFTYDYELKASDDDAQRLSMPNRPKPHSSSDDPAYDCGTSKRPFITTDKDWDAAVLQTSVHLDLPDGDRTYADVLSALAKASGFGVVCEDFATCRTGPSAELKSQPKDTTIGATLKKLNGCWFSIDEKEHLILGWAKAWRGHHRDLVPESVLSTLSAKIHGTGAELDDVTPLANLTTGQVNEWLDTGRNDQLTQFAQLLPNRMLWRMYDALPPDSKLRAKMPTGTSLAELDMEALREDFRRLRRYDELTVAVGTSATEAEKQTAVAEARAIAAVLADPTQLHGATLRIRMATVAFASPAGTTSRAADTSTLHRYWMEIEFPKDEGAFKMRVDGGPSMFPIRAEEKKP